MPLWTCLFLFFIFILVIFQKENTSMYDFIAEEEVGLEEHFVVEKRWYKTSWMKDQQDCKSC